MELRCNLKFIKLAYLFKIKTYIPNFIIDDFKRNAICDNERIIKRFLRDKW